MVMPGPGLAFKPGMKPLFFALLVVANFAAPEAFANQEGHQFCTGDGIEVEVSDYLQHSVISVSLDESTKHYRVLQADVDAGDGVGNTWYSSESHEGLEMLLGVTLPSHVSIGAKPRVALKCKFGLPLNTRR